MALIKLNNIFKTYHVGEIDVPVLKGVSLEVERGEYVALMGASGSGKSTLMNILGCLDRPSSGEYWIDGEEVSQYSNDRRALIRNRKIGFVFQNFNLLSRTSALENVIMPLTYTADHMTSKDKLNRGSEMLDRMGLKDRQHHHPSQLSGGQQQRVAIARALAMTPKVLLCDEITSALDPELVGEVLRVLEQLAAEGMTLILVTHEMNFAREVGDRVVFMHQGTVWEQGDSKTLFANPQTTELKQFISSVRGLN